MTTAVWFVSFLSVVFLVTSARADERHGDQDRDAQCHDKDARCHQKKDHWCDKDKRCHDKKEHCHGNNARCIDGDGECHNQRVIRLFNYGYIVPVVRRVNYVTPSVGSLVDSLPEDHSSVIINGLTYAVYQDVFYLQTTSRYQVIDPSTLAPNSGSFTIDLINTDGQDTQIQMQAQYNGYIGPQGEFYPQFPSIQQLQAMYVQ
jgi:hypothetical protein